MPLIEETSYAAPALLRNRHLSTVFANKLRFPKKMKYERVEIDTPDGDFLELDWSRVGSERAVLLSHGLEGNSRSAYILGMARHFNSMGWDVCTWHFRSCGGKLNRSSTFYHPAQMEDVNAVLEHMLEKGRYKSVGLIGFSMGGSYTLNYMARYKAHFPSELIGAIAFSTPFEMGDTSIQLSEGAPSLYGRFFLNSYRRKMTQKEKVMPGTYDLALWDQIRCIRDFDELFNKKWYGFSEVEDFYRHVSPIHFLDQIELPTLVVNAENDPFLPASSYPREQAAANSNLFLEVPTEGGHIGFVSSTWKGIYWSESRAEAFLSGLL